MGDNQSLGENQTKEQNQVFQNIMQNAEKQIKQESTVKAAKAPVVLRQDILTQEGMTIFASIMFFILVKIFVRRKWINKILSAACLFGLYTSTLTFLGAKYQSKLPCYFANAMLLIIICFYIKGKSRKGVKLNEG